LEALVIRRAGGRCEYCQLPQNVAETPFSVDHIIAEKHGGATVAGNLAWACFYCNTCKGPNIAGLDPVTGRLTRLFHPRTDAWRDHFEWHGAWLAGKTAVGRATVQVLNINEPEAVAVRDALMEEGAF